MPSSGHPQRAQAAGAGASSCRASSCEPLPDEVELPPETGDTLRGQRADQGARRPRGDRRGGDRRRLGDRGRRARRRPGVHSARYAGEDASDEENLEKLLREVDAPATTAAPPTSARSPWSTSDGHEHVFEAPLRGDAAARARAASGGFGYDPAFVPDDTGHGDERTMAELSPEEKNAISHRGRAARMLARHLGLEAGAGP